MSAAPFELGTGFSAVRRFGTLRGPLTARVMVVGEAWGADEARLGAPFVGPSGRLLGELLSAVGINPEEVYYTNLVNERPPSNDLMAWMTPEGLPQGPLIQGLLDLQAEIARVNPNVIIPVGNFPLRFICGKGNWKKKEGPSGIGNYRGSILQGTALTGGRKCIPTYHPAAVLRQYTLKHICKLDLGRAMREQQYAEIRRPGQCIVIDPRGPDRDAWGEWLKSSPGTPSPAFKYTEGWQVDPATEGERRSNSDTFLSGDIEYLGGKLLCIGFTRSDDVSIVFKTNDASDLEFIRGILLSGVPLCFQNGMFDCSILEWFYSIECIQYLKHDTMVAMHCAYTEFAKDLGFIGSVFTEEPVWWDKANWKESAWVESAGMLYYNAKDVRVTHSAMLQLLDDELVDPEIRAAYDYEMSLIQPLWEISKRGVAIDTKRLMTLREQLESELVLIGKSLKVLNGRELNVKSGPQVIQFVYEILGCPRVGGKTPTGAWSTDDVTLATIQLKCRDERQRQGIKLVRSARERRDLISKFCEIELDTDERMRCHYDPAKTDTSRLSSRKFYPTGNGANLQNVPRDTRVRSVFVPDRGYIFGYADLKSAESLVVAHITGDPEMLRLHSPEYMDGQRDGHKYVASFLLGKPIDQVTKDDRYLGKRVRHAGNYGMSWHKLMQLINADAQTTGVSVDAAQAKALITKYRQLHPYLQNWWDDVSLQLQKTHTIYTRHGRKRVFYDRPDSILPEAIAYDPQGTVAQTLNMGLLRIDTRYHRVGHDNWMRQWDMAHQLADQLNAEMCAALEDKGFQMLLQVHDAIGFQVPEANIDAACALLPALMDIPIPIKRRGIEPYDIHIPIDIQVGYNWGEYDSKKPDLNPNGLRGWKGGK